MSTSSKDIKRFGSILFGWLTTLNERVPGTVDFRDYYSTRSIVQSILKMDPALARYRVSKTNLNRAVGRVVRLGARLYVSGS